MHEILLFLFYAKEKFGQGSIYDQQMSEYIFVTNCSFENRRHKKEEKKNYMYRRIVIIINNVVILFK